MSTLKILLLLGLLIAVNFAAKGLADLMGDVQETSSEQHQAVEN